MKPRIYIAGPISKGDLAANIRQASEAFFRLLKAGFAPFCPHWSAYSGGPYEAPVPQSMPNGTTHEDWLGVDLPWVSVSDALLRLPGESVGADREVKEAERWAVPVYYDIEKLLAVESPWMRQDVVSPLNGGIPYPPRVRAEPSLT